jgi:hypothetical protein
VGGERWNLDPHPVHPHPTHTFTPFVIDFILKHVYWVDWVDWVGVFFNSFGKNI